MTTTTGTEYVRELRVVSTGGSVTAVVAVLATPVDIDGVMQGDLEREVDAWTDAPAQGQTDFQGIIDYILTL